MSKRRMVAGGYEESSDDIELDTDLGSDNPAKRAKSASYAPVRLTTVSKTGHPSFQFPLSRSSSAPGPVPSGSITSSSSHSRGPSQPISLAQRVASDFALGSQNDHAMLDTPTQDTDPNILGIRKASGDRGAGVKTSGALQNSGLGATLANTSHIRSAIALERRIQELTEGFESYIASNDAQHRETHSILARFFEVLESTGSAPPLRHPALIGSVLPPSRPTFSNPSPTPELIETVTKVVNETRLRVGKKKGGSEDNSFKEHARNTFYRMLAISAAKAVNPYFEDEYGEPDTLPSQFMDQETGYCQPFPHWKAALTKQVLWVPTYIERFRSTVPNDSSELSIKLRSLSDEQIVVLLHDGPFKTAQTAWRDMKKSDEELEVMRKYAQKYQRTERKVIARMRLMREISELQDSQWEFLTQAGYMSADESDDEGNIITKRPDYRANWVTNVYEAMRVHQIQASKQHPSLGPPLQRRIEIVKLPLPHLERGTGAGKVTIRIAQCAISKSWREKDAGELLKYNQFINFRAVKKPDVSAFLAQYPAPVDHGSNGDHNDWASAPMTPIDFGRADDGAWMTGHEGDDLGRGQPGEETVVTRDDTDEAQGEGAVSNGLHLTGDSGETGGTRRVSDSAIDPKLLPPSIGIGATKGRNMPRPKMRQASGALDPALAVSTGHQVSEPTKPHDARESTYDLHSPHAQMPPPPPLQPELGLGSVGGTPNENPPILRSQRSAGGSATASVTPVQGVINEPGPSNVPVPNTTKPQKKRGRPAGSKNKKKEKES